MISKKYNYKINPFISYGEHRITQNFKPVLSIHKIVYFKWEKYGWGDVQRYCSKYDYA